ncbi:DUF2304 domain-containing protein [Diaphorobacter ruginosibacter]|uniref:DUF2304 domain-containing protein n=1 Tax=Diaphorobacter ruginosibacter TaxID=1715720 RepID=A0A7G9RQV5_9BURK|nr:DUF2304 domain-containing protein [Diaphorobacter ruginosibacter]QNN57980.1 DUF2304 domain-containing protein [Diaphorobacter ruginosibacter]
MASLQTTTLLLGVGLAILILYLIRRDHLYLMHGLFWVAVAAAAALLGAWPGLVDRIAYSVGISYPPALLLLFACIVLFIKALHADMVNTRIERDVRRLNQRLAMLEADMENLPRNSAGHASISVSASQAISTYHD